MDRFFPPTHRLLTLLSISALTGVGACKKKEDPKPEVTAEKAPAETAPKVEAPKKEPIPITAPGRITRGAGLGHFMIAHPTTLLDEVRQQVAPSSLSFFVSEQVFRNYLSGSLGDRGKLADHLRLDQPLGCAVLDVPSEKEDLPIACILGYTGGVDSLLVDLGPEGKQKDAGKHSGYYKLDDQDVYIDAVGELVAISNQPNVFEAAKGYLSDVMIARASAIDVDIEVVAFPSAAFKRYEQPLTEFIKQTQGAATPAGDSGLEKSIADYSQEANEKTIEQIKNSEQIQVGLGLDGQGLMASWMAVPVPGSEMETRNKALAGAGVSAENIAKLPAASWALMAAKSLEMDAQGSLRNAGVSLAVSAIVERTGRERGEVEQQINTLLAEFQALYGTESVSSLMHIPDTDGGLVIEVPLKEAQSGRDSWKAWSEKFTPASVLGADGAKKVTWKFQADAATYEEVPIDRWVIEPTPEGSKELKKEAKDWEKRTKGYKLVVDRLEHEGRAAFVLALGDSMPYTQAVIDALKGKQTITGVPGYDSVKERVGDAGSIVAVDVQRASDWLRQVMPPSEASKLPPSLGVDLSDILMSNRWEDTGSSSGQVRLSQAFIDRLRALAEQQQQ